MIKLKGLLKEIDFPTQKAFDTYNKSHKLRPTTKVTVAGKSMTAGQAAQNSKPVKGKSVFGGDKSKETASPKTQREGKPEVNKKVIDAALELDITPMEYATAAYEEKIYQAAVEALTDSNFHQEARELIAKLENKPEWAKKPEYGTPEYEKWEKSGVYKSKYWDGDEEGNNAGKLGRIASEESGWDGVVAVDAIAAQARKMGSDKVADTLQSIFDNKPYMKEDSMKLSSMIKKK